MSLCLTNEKKRLFIKQIEYLRWQANQHALYDLEAALSSAKMAGTAVVREAQGGEAVSLRDNLDIVADDPGWLDRQKKRWELQARRAELANWPELCNGDIEAQERHKRTCKYHRALAALDRQLAALGKEQG